MINNIENIKIWDFCKKLSQMNMNYYITVLKIDFLIWV